MALCFVLDFNSIKVRLEPIYALSLIAAYLFQFHKGTIRTPNAIGFYEGRFISIP